MDFYTHLYAKPAQTAMDQDEQPKEDEKKSEEQENSPTAKDGFFGLFNRSEAAKKGWETRKQNGGVGGQKQWTPGVWPKQNNTTQVNQTKPKNPWAAKEQQATTTQSPLSVLPKHLTQKRINSEYDANREMYAASKDELPEDAENDKSVKKIGAAQLVAMRKKAGLPMGKTLEQKAKKD